MKTIKNYTYNLSSALDSICVEYTVIEKYNRVRFYIVLESRAVSPVEGKYTIVIISPLASPDPKAILNTIELLVSDAISNLNVDAPSYYKWDYKWDKDIIELFERCETSNDIKFTPYIQYFSEWEELKKTHSKTGYNKRKDDEGFVEGVITGAFLG